MSARNPAITSRLPETGVEWEIGYHGENSGNSVIEVSFDEDLYDTGSPVHHQLVEDSPDSLMVTYDQDTAYIAVKEDEDVSETVLDYLEVVDEALADERDISTREERKSSAIDAISAAANVDQNAAFREELTYSDLGVEVLYQGENEDSHGFRYRFDEFMYDDYAEHEALTVNDRTKQVLEGTGSEAVDMEFTGMTEATVDVDASDIDTAVDIVYNHLEELDQEYAEIQQGANSRDELESEIASLLNQEALIENF